MKSSSRLKVVVIGAGFGGLKAVRKLKGAPVDITLVDRSNHHLFQPLLYQVAMAALSPADVATPVRGLLRDQDNCDFIMAEATSIDRAAQMVHLANDTSLPYDYLVVATGNQPSYFGNDAWSEQAPGLKTIADALDIRERILTSFELANGLPTAAERQPYLTFVCVGGGPTGVEMAGALAEIGQKTMTRDFPNFDADEIKVTLLEGADRLLLPYDPELSDRARRDLEKMGVEVRLGYFVEEVGEGYVVANGERFHTQNIIWAAGNTASPIVEALNTETNDIGQVLVGPDVALTDDENVFVIGDAAYVEDTEGKAVPGQAPGANQMGEYVASIISQQLPRGWREPFVYFDKGMMATIGRAKAVAQIRRFRITGLMAWLMWSGVHIFFLVNAKSRIRVLIEWIWYYITFRPGARLLYNRRFRSGKMRQPVSSVES